MPRATRLLARARTVPCEVDLPFPELVEEERWAPEPAEPCSPMTAAITRPHLHEIRLVYLILILILISCEYCIISCYVISYHITSIFILYYVMFYYPLFIVPGLGLGARAIHGSRAVLAQGLKVAVKRFGIRRNLGMLSPKL